MLLLRVRALYHLRKARVLSPKDHSYLAYRNDLHLARRQVHLQSVLYQQQIQDQYLARHHEAMRQRHHDNQCSFRKQVLTDAYRLQQNQIKWQQTDSIFTSRLNKHLHDEDVRKINRSRIIKIMEHESQHYWFNAENVDHRLKEDSLFPQYIASSEYYYKLFAEALAYQLGDLQELHRVTSNEEIIREKNKYLIPLYLTLRSKIVAYKHDQLKELKHKHSLDVDKIRNSKQHTQQQIQQIENQLSQTLNDKIKEIEDSKNTPQAKIEQLTNKLKDLVSILKTWKQYTNVLALTSAQIIRNQADFNSEAQIHKAEKEVMNTMKSRSTQTFVDSIEEDTEQIQITFEDYLTKINQQRKETQVSPSESSSMSELDALINEAQASIGTPDTPADSLVINPNDQLDLSKLINPTPKKEDNIQANSKEVGEEINPEFLNPKETTSSVQILKEQFKSDKNLQTLLNQLGEIDVRYPKLLETIWNSVHN